MKIETLRNKYEFTKDDHCITLYRVNKITNKESSNYNKEIKQFIGHYSGIEGVLKKLHSLELIDKGTIEDLLTDVARVNGLMLGVRKSLEKTE